MLDVGGLSSDSKSTWEDALTVFPTAALSSSCVNPTR